LRVITVTDVLAAPWILSGAAVAGRAGARGAEAIMARQSTAAVIRPARLVDPLNAPPGTRGPRRHHA
jgi:hypothetical protein